MYTRAVSDYTRTQVEITLTRPRTQAVVTVHDYDIVLDVLIINQLNEPMHNLCLELATVSRPALPQPVHAFVCICVCLCVDAMRPRVRAYMHKHLHAWIRAGGRPQTV